MSLGNLGSTYILTGLGCLVAFLLWNQKPRGAPLPPGPKPTPIFGNIKDIPLKEPWLWAERLAKQYGDVVYMHFLGRPLVFLTSPEAAYDLLEKRSLSTSDRPTYVMMGELCGVNQIITFMPFTDRLKRHRRLMNKALGSIAIPAYYPLLQSSTITFLRKLIESPPDFINHGRWYAGGITLSVVFGYEPAYHNDKYLALAFKWIDMLSAEILGGKGIWPVDLIPALKYLPSWLPGGGFKRKAAWFYGKTDEFATIPYEFAKSSINSGIFKPSYCSTLLEDQELTKELEYDIKWTSNSIYVASSDTTVATVTNLMLALMENPEIVAKARAEIDSVVGTDRLPTFNDRKHLPYVEAVFTESLRWAVPIPLNLPHCTNQDEIYRGMFIPKGTWVVANLWAMVRNERLYPDPFRFDPERYLGKPYEETGYNRNPRSIVFGFGRRICPGLHLVESSIWLLIVCMIATLDITKAVDEHGNVIEPNVSYDVPQIRLPNRFKCNVKPRSEQAAKLISETDLALL